MTSRTKLWALSAGALALSLALAGCGGGSSGPSTASSGGDDPTPATPTPTPTPVALTDLQGGQILATGLYRVTGAEADLDTLLAAVMGITVPEGGFMPGSAAVTAGGLMLMCSQNSAANCNIVVNDDYSVSVTGTILVTMSGGMYPDDRTDDQMRADANMNVNTGFSAAVTEGNNAEAAKKAADMALATAQEKDDELDAVTVQGDSGAAMYNAQTVLNQRDAVATAHMDATTAETNLGTAKTNAENTTLVPMDHSERANLLAAIDAAIEDVDGYIKDIEGVRGGAELKAALDTVEKDAAYGYKAKTATEAAVPGTARGVGESVAMDVAMLLLPTESDPAETLDGDAVGVFEVPNVTDLDAGPAEADPILDADGRFNYVNGPVPSGDKPGAATGYRTDKHLHGRTSRTWAQLTAELPTKDVLLATSTTGGEPQTIYANAVLANGAEGLAAIDTAAAEAETAMEDGVARYSVFYNATWKGLSGAFVCWDGPCGVVDDGDDDAATINKLASATDNGRMGSWYFVPQSLTAAGAPRTVPEVIDGGHPSYSSLRSYVATGDDTYTIDKQFAAYGYWLEVFDHDNDNDASTPDQLGMRRYAITVGNTENLAWNVNTEADATRLTDTEATFTGPAIGMSVLKGTMADGMEGPVASGHFDADVELIATFGASPMLGGSIDNFQGDAVNTGWFVTLTDVTVGADGTIPDGEAEGSGPGGVGQNGERTATAYGPAQTTVDSGTLDHRPAGITGTFDAHFADGHAAGVYATRKKD